MKEFIEELKYNKNIDEEKNLQKIVDIDYVIERLQNIEKGMKIKNIEKELESLKLKDLSLLDLMIYDEITCQLEEEITDEELENLMSYVENAYLKTDSVSLWSIVRFCLYNREKLETLSSWDIVDGACNYE